MIKKFDQEIRTRNSIKNFDHWARAVPRPVLGEMVPEQGQRLGIKAGIWCSGARAGSGTGFQAWYGTKWGQGRVRDWGPRPVLDEMGRGQGQGLVQIGLGQSQGLGTNVGI